MSIARRRIPRRARFTVLAPVVVAVLFVLTSPFGGGAPAQADWNECNTHVVSLDPLVPVLGPGNGHAVRASTNPSPNGGEVGVCVLALGLCGPVVGCSLTGFAVTTNNYDVFPQTGFFTVPQVCVTADIVIDHCQPVGLTGAEVGTDFISVCAAGVCQPIRP